MAVSGLAFGLMPILAVRAYDRGVTVPTLLFLRFAIASVLLWLLAWALGALRRPTRREVAATVLLGGVLYTAQSSLYFGAVGRIAPALAVLLLYLYPAMIAAATALRTRRRPGRTLLAALGLTFAGVALAGGRVAGTLDVVGVVMAVAAAVSYATYVMAGGAVAAHLPPLQTSAMVTGAAAVVLGAFRLGGGAGDPFPPQGAWVEILALAIVCGVIAIGTFLAGIPLVGPTRAAILSTLEPAIGVVGAWALLGQALGAAQWLGVVLVLVGAALSARTTGAADAPADLPVAAAGWPARRAVGRPRPWGRR